jgi:hypothetical protein
LRKKQLEDSVREREIALAEKLMKDIIYEEAKEEEARISKVSLVIVPQNAWCHPTRS